MNKQDQNDDTMDLFLSSDSIQERKNKMETPTQPTPTNDSSSRSPERGRAWLIVAIVLTLHAAVLGGVVLIQGCSKSSSSSMAENAQLTSPSDDKSFASKDATTDDKANVTAPGHDMLTPEESLTESDASKTSASNLADASKGNQPSTQPAAVETAPKEAAPAVVETVAVPVAPKANAKYAVKKGDTLSKIAKQYSVSVADLTKANKLTVKSSLKIGQMLEIPGKTEVAQASKPSAPVVAAAPKTATAKTHIVASRETITSIAKRYGVTPQALMSANQITDPRKIKINQKLVIPSTKVAKVEPVSTPAVDTTKIAQPAATEESIVTGKVVKDT